MKRSCAVVKVLRQELPLGTGKKIKIPVEEGKVVNRVVVTLFTVVTLLVVLLGLPSKD